MKRKLAPLELDTADLQIKFDNYLKNEKKVTEQQYENITKDMGVFNVGGIKNKHGYTIGGGVNPAYAWHFMDFQEKHPEYFMREVKPVHYDEYLKNYFDEPMVFVELSNYNKETKQSLSKEEFIVTKMFAHLHKQIKENSLMSNKELYALIKEHNLNAQRFLYSLSGRKIKVSIYLLRDIFFKHLPEFEDDYSMKEAFS